MEKNRKIVLLLLLCMMSGLIFGCAPLKKQKEYSSQQFLMDTVINIQVFGPEEATLKKAVEDAYAELSRIALLTDRFAKPNTAAYEASEVCKINSQAGKIPVKVGEDTYKMAELSLYYDKLSGDAFDITVGPLMDLWGFATEQPKVPTDAEIKEKLSFLDSSAVILNKEEKTVYLKKAGMSLDLGAIAKGYAAEKAAQVLRKAGIKQAIVNAGGNIVVVGKKDEKTPWKIGIEDPRSRSELVGILSLNDEAAVTSGDYQRNFTENGVLYHHIISPATGKPARETWSVTVIAKDSGIADVLSTTLFVLGPEKGLKFIENMEGVEAFFVGADKKIRISPGLKDRVTVQPGANYTYDSK